MADSKDRKSSKNQFELNVSDWNEVEMAKACFSSFEFPLHFHDTYTIQMVDEGIDRFVCGGSVFEATRGDVVVIGPGVTHSGQPGNSIPLKYRSIYPPAEIVSQCVDTSRLPSIQVVFRGYQRLSTAFNRLFSAMSAAELLCTNESMIEFCKLLFCGPESSSIRPRKAPSRHPKVLRSLEYLRANYSNKVSLNQLANESCVNKFHLLSLFKSEFGMTPHRYLMNYRLLRARQMLLSGSGIAAVAMKTGFSDQSHFTREFKRYVGVAPGRYRALYR